MKFEKTEVFNFEGALRGMRNPMESWDKSDSRNWQVGEANGEPVYDFEMGEKDLKLAQTLIRAGKDHRKFMRQIVVSVDITAPLYWWKEFDTYGVGVVKNSTSTMHKLADTEITMDCFEMGDFDNSNYNIIDVDDAWEYIIDVLDILRCRYNETKDKRYWKELIRLLPESWLQKRTVTMNYENLIAIAHSDRKNHKLTEWCESFFDWMKTLPYAEELIFIKIPDARELQGKLIELKKELSEINKMVEVMVGSGGKFTDDMCFEIQDRINKLMED